MDVVIHLARAEPPAGTVAVLGEPPITFVGWLGLLRALAAFLSVPDESAVPDALPNDFHEEGA